jgi:hypothetical protein
MYNIPVVINNFNRLTLTKRLANDLWIRGYTNIHILDNNSSYPKLLEWYDSQEARERYTIKRLDQNYQALSVYNSGYINEWLNKCEWIAYTDSDLILNPLCPNDFVYRLILYARKYNVGKAGLALETRDLPDTLYGNHYREWEHRYWTEQARLEPDVYNACIDTTFCVIRVGQPFDYVAVRVAGNLTAKHGPWYTDFQNMDEEETYYLSQCTSNSSYKRFYNNCVMGLPSI